MAITDEDLERQLPVVKESTMYTRSKLSLEQKRRFELPTEICREGIYVAHSIGDYYLRTEQDFKRICDGAERMSTMYFSGIRMSRSHLIKVRPSLTWIYNKGKKGFKRSYVLIDEDKIHFVNLEDIL